jgi:hypothetical protein
VENNKNHSKKTQGINGSRCNLELIAEKTVGFLNAWIPACVGMTNT